MRTSVIALLLSASTVFAGEPIPGKVADVLAGYCLDCHDAESEKGDLNLDFPEIDWQDPHAVGTWTNVFDALSGSEMPPEDKKQPTMAERQAVLSWLDKTLTQNSRPGGTVLRRLNRTEYENSVRALLGIPFTVPEGFPADTEFHGFDNLGEGLVLSPPTMQQYFELAGVAADAVIPPRRKAEAIELATFLAPPETFSMAFEASQFRDGAMRLVVKSDVLIRACSWPTRFEAKHTGTYTVKSSLSAFKPASAEPLRVELLVIKPSETFSDIGNRPRVASFEIPTDGETHEVSADVDLETGESVAFLWANAPFGWTKQEGRQEAGRQLRELFLGNPRLYAAWLKVGYNRARTPKQTWQQLKDAMAKDDLDTNNPKVLNPPSRYPATGQNQLSWALQNMFMEQGPGLDIHGASFTGPTAVKLSRAEQDQAKRTARFLGERDGRRDRDFAQAILQRVLSQAFRRPVAEELLATYLAIALGHQAEGNRFEDGIHLALRAALCSPHFLYRGQRKGVLDDYDLASRLSYFLSSSPPDSKLAKLAAAGSLADANVLHRETRRLLADRRIRNFLSSFTGQWLDLDALPDIMPDERLTKWTRQDLDAVTDETQLFVAEILRKNLPLETFIAPDFTYLNRWNAKLYGIKSEKSTTMRRVTIPPDSRHGGILGQASVMMATANGVDTQPVLRGVWLLENVFGTPTPEAPSNVPAIEPDTSGATSIRDLLTRHQEDPSCASCHRKIDPPGFALENFDPVGRWRDFYPRYEKGEDGEIITHKGQPVDAAATLPDGTELKDVTDLKRYLVTNIDQFSACLTGKLLTYATGRSLSYGDRKEIARIVASVKKEGNGFADLIVAVVQSESFRVK
jgi:hypothetical protein